MSSARKGFSLIEILVACVLLILILTLIFQVVIPMGRGTVRGSQQMELQQVGTNAINKLADDLQKAPPAGITRIPATGPPPGNTPLLLSIQPLSGVDSIGQQVWSEQLIIYWWYPGSQELRRMTWPPGYPLGRRPDIDEPFKPTWNELKRLTDNPRGRDKMIGLVKDLNIDLSVVPHELGVQMEAKSPDGSPPEIFTLSRRVYVRNERY